MNIIERFNQYVTYEPNTGCHLWTGNYKHTGYGGFTYYNNKSMTSSRASYLIFKGEIPNGMQVCHSCDVKECVNPDHLFVGTHKDNVQDMIQKGRKMSSFGVLNGMSKITDEIVRTIRQNYTGAWGEQKRLCEQYGISAPQMSGLLNNKFWRHI